MATINFEELDEHDQRIFRENVPNEEFLLYKPPAPPQSSQTEKYIENLLGAHSQDYIVARGKPLTQTTDKDDSVPRLASPPQESKKSRKRKRAERQTNTRTDHDLQEDIVNFTSKKPKEVETRTTTPSTTDPSTAVTGAVLLPIAEKHTEVPVSEHAIVVSESAISVPEPEVSVQPTPSPVVQPAVADDTNEQIHSAESTGVTSDEDPQRWLLNINKIVAEHSVLEGNAKTLERRVHELQTQLAGKEVLARKIAGFGTDIDRIQRSMREGRSLEDQSQKEFNTLRREQATAIKALKDLQSKFTTSQREGVQLCRDYKTRVEQLQDFNNRLTDQLSDKVGQLSEARGCNMQLQRELAMHVDKWNRSVRDFAGYGNEFGKVMEKVKKDSVRNNETITELCVAISDLQEAFADKDKDLANKEAHDKAMRVLEEVKTAVAGVATTDQGQEIARSIGTLNTTMVEKFDAVLVHGQDHRTNASLSAEIMCLNSRITDLSEEKAQLKKDLDTANESVVGLRVQSLTQADSESRLRAESARLQSRLDDHVSVPDIAEERKALEEKMTADLESRRAELSCEFKKLKSACKAAVANENKALKYENLKTKELLKAADQSNAKLKEKLSDVEQANDHLSRKTEGAKRETDEYKEKLQQMEVKLQQAEASLQQAEQRLQQREPRPSTLTTHEDQQSLESRDDETSSELSEPPSSEVGRSEQASQSTRPNTASKRLPSGSGRNVQSVKHGSARSVGIGDVRESEEPAEGTDEETQGSLYVDSQSQQARASKTPTTRTTRRPTSTRAAKSSAKSSIRYENRWDQELGF